MIYTHLTEAILDWAAEAADRYKFSKVTSLHYLPYEIIIKLTTENFHQGGGECKTQRRMQTTS